MLLLQIWQDIYRIMAKPQRRVCMWAEQTDSTDLNSALSKTPESTFVIIWIFIIFISLGVIYFRPGGGQPKPKSPDSSLQLNHGKQTSASLV